MNTKKLYRSVNDRMIAGVWRFGSYFKIDANLVRVILVVLSIASCFVPVDLRDRALIILWSRLPCDMTIQKGNQCSKCSFPPQINSFFCKGSAWNNFQALSFAIFHL